MNRLNIALACAAFASIAAAAPANAATLQHAFTATIMEVSPFDTSRSSDEINRRLADIGIEIGASAGGGYTLDTDATDFNADPNVGRYLQAVSNLYYFFGDLVVDTAPGGNADGSSRLDVADGSMLGDFWAVSSSLDFESPYGSNGIFEMILRQDDGGVFNGGGLDQSLPPLCAFDPFGPASPLSTSIGMIADIDGLGLVYVRAELETYTVVPVPAAAWLLLGGLGSLVGFGRRTSPASGRAIFP